MTHFLLFIEFCRAATGFRRCFWPSDEKNRPPDGLKRPYRRYENTFRRYFWPPDEKNRPPDGLNRPSDEMRTPSEDIFGLQTGKIHLQTPGRYLQTRRRGPSKEFLASRREKLPSRQEKQAFRWLNHGLSAISVIFYKDRLSLSFRARPGIQKPLKRLPRETVETVIYPRFSFNPGLKSGANFPRFVIPDPNRKSGGRCGVALLPITYYLITFNTHLIFFY